MLSNWFERRGQRELVLLNKNITSPRMTIQMPLEYVCFGERCIFDAINRSLIVTETNIQFEYDNSEETRSKKISRHKIIIDDIDSVESIDRINLLKITVDESFYERHFSFTKTLPKQTLFDKTIWFCLKKDHKSNYSEKVRSINKIFDKKAKIISDKLLEEFQTVMYHSNQIGKNRIDFIDDWSQILIGFQKLKQRSILDRLGSKVIRNGKRKKDEFSSVDEEEDDERTVNRKRLRTDKTIEVKEKEQKQTSKNKRSKKYDLEKERKLLEAKVTYYSSEVSLIDLKCLRPATYLNDNIIHFYMTYIYHEILNEDQRKQSYFFSCFFNTKLLSGEDNRIPPFERHKRVAKWTKNVDIFEKNYLIIPVIEKQHWFLVIVCFPWMAGVINYAELLSKKSKSTSNDIPENQTEFATKVRKEKIEKIKLENKFEPRPCILIFDSYCKPRVSKVNMIREYLKCEWDSRRSKEDGRLVFDKNTVRGFCPQVPQQTNTYDCGLFLLHYVETFYKKPFTDFSLEFFQSELLNWFELSEIKSKRSHIKSVIQNCKSENASSSSTNG